MSAALFNTSKIDLKATSSRVEKVVTLVSYKFLPLYAISREFTSVTAYNFFKSVYYIYLVDYLLDHFYFIILHFSVLME